MRQLASYAALLLLTTGGLSLPGRSNITPRTCTIQFSSRIEGASKTSASRIPSYEDLRKAGIAALYNLDFRTARENFRHMAEAAVDQPQSYVYLASTSLVEILNKSRRLSSSLYAGGSFYTQSPGADPADAEASKQFNNYIDRALAASSELLKKNSRNVDALYYQASALGLRAAYIAMVQRSFRKAFDDANNSVRIDKQVLKLDPSRSDAYLYIGLYEYVIGCLPFFWRLLARFAGLPGSRDRGIQELENVVASGEAASDDARVLLIPIYYREGQVDRALGHAESLAARYPGNYLFAAERARTLYAAGRAREGYGVFKQLTDQPRVAAEAKDLVNYRWGEALQSVRDFSGALAQYKQVVEWAASDYDLVTQAHLHAGEMLDCLNNRAEALAEYQRVLSRRNIYDCQDQAREHLKHPYRPN